MDRGKDRQLVNVLHLIESSETGGAETVFAELVARVDRTRYAPHVALLHDGWLRGRIEGLGIAPIMIPTREGALDTALLRGLFAAVRRHRIGLVHSHLFTTNLYASVACAPLRIPVISTFHGTMDVGEGDRAKRVKWRVMNALSRRVVFVSRYLRDHFLHDGLAREGKADVIYNGIDIARFRAAPDRAAARAALALPEDAFVIGCVGDLRPAKDYGTAIRALAELRRSLPTARLVIAGSSTPLRPELEALRDGLGLRDAVAFIGFQPAIERVLPAFDVYLSSSTSEGFSLTVVEAMASGLPVVATRSGGPQEIIRDGETGVLVPAGLPSAIADAIGRIASDRARTRTLAQAGSRLAEERFSIGAMVGAYESLYAETLQRRA